MAKIHPQAFLSSASSSSFSNYIAPTKEIFTIWMKSLISNSNGCTVLDSNGKIIYRIDNYEQKYSDEVYLMDLRGDVLFTILRKKLRLFGRWEGYKSNGSKMEQVSWFKVRKPCRILKGDSPCQVTVGWNKDRPDCYRIEGLAGKSACKRVDKAGRLVAEISFSKALLLEVKLGIQCIEEFEIQHGPHRGQFLSLQVQHILHGCIQHNYR
ncbi:protein LURP-one-related 11-like [Tasmannia lanceolata]|uniref:protein LURP-one-related 11-like n=1 Tax=Tasmannia lanceolata TaxID=3420 RepID=UPI004063D95B